VTHKQLVKIGRAWLRAKGCCLVLSEKASPSGETPDVIAWRNNGHSILIECKTSRSDFRRDKDKWFRSRAPGLGQQRYFMAPVDIIPKNELPDGWGLLEVKGTIVKTIVQNDLLYYDARRAAAELPLLVACLRQAKIKLSMQRKNRRELRNRA
jgi:hypothetical protein